MGMQFFFHDFNLADCSLTAKAKSNKSNISNNGENNPGQFEGIP